MDNLKPRYHERLRQLSAQLVAAVDATENLPYGAHRGHQGGVATPVREENGNNFSDFPVPGRPPSATPVEGYLAHKKVSDSQIEEWVEQFHTEGFLYLPSVLPPTLCAQLRDDLDWALANRPAGEGAESFHPRMFELSAANLSLFELEPICSFAEALIGGGPGRQAGGSVAGRPQSCHVVHNNSFKTLAKSGGDVYEKGKGGWHQDDPLHLWTTDGQPLPPKVRLAVQLFTANYHLTDIDTPDNGPTECVRGSHLFGRSCEDPEDIPEYKAKMVAPCGPAGGVVMFNNQVWHRGRPNTSDRTRYITQISYASYLVGHKFFRKTANSYHCSGVAALNSAC